MSTFLVYTFVVLASYLLARKATKADQIGYIKRSRGYNIIIVVIMSMICGLRDYSVGTDTVAYAALCESYGQDTYFEVGFRYLVQFLMVVGGSPTFVFIVISFIINALFVVAFWKYKNVFDYDISIILFSIMMYFLTFSGIRQFLAVAAYFFGTTLLLKRKKRNYIFFGLLCVAMTTIHASVLIGLIVIPIYYLCDVSIKKHVTVFDLFLILIGIVAVIVGIYVIYSRLMDSYGTFFDAPLSSPLLGYMVLFKTLLLLITCYSIYSKKIPYDCQTDCIKLGEIQSERVLIIVCLIFDAFFQVSSFLGYFYPTISRIGWYWLPFEVLMYSYIIARFREKRFFINAVMVLVILLYLYFGMFLTDGNNIIPYLMH